MTTRIRILLLGIILLLVGITGCGIPKEDRQTAEALPKKISSARTEVTNRQNSYLRFSESEEYFAYKVYAERENWINEYQEALSEINRAGTLYSSSIYPILEKNDSDDKFKLRQEVSRINNILQAARTQSLKPSQRREFIEKAMAEAPAWVEKAEDEYFQINEIISDTSAYADKAKSDYKDKVKDIGERFAVLMQIQINAKNSLYTAQQELNNRENGDVTDYAKLGDSTRKVTSLLGQLQREVQIFRSKTDELYQSYSKILADMRVEYWVEIGRTSWDNYYDFPTEHQYIYKRKVEEPVFQYFSKPLPEQIAYKSWGDLKVVIDQVKWNSLKINPEEYMPSGDDGYEFWVNDAEPKFFHKYIHIKNGEKTETDWVQVDDEEFEENQENLGMEILSKPYGCYESEKLEEAAPAGMSYVGNRKYGEWRRDDQGRSFWHYYGQYAFMNSMFGGNRTYIYRDHYDTWHRDYRGRDSYYGYGAAGSTSRWGSYSKGVRTSPTFAGSTWSRSGGFKRMDSSVRGAGSRSRGRGPGGGGK